MNTNGVASSLWQRHETSNRLLPPMIERKYGRIVNVASLAWRIPSSGGHTVYAASQAFPP